MNQHQKQSVTDKREPLATLNVFRAFCAASLIIVIPQTSIAQDMRTGALFKKALSQSMSLDFELKPVRSIVQKFGTDRGIAVVLDRRLDPDLIVSISVRDKPALDAFQQIADKSNGVLSELNNVVFIGSPTSTAKLRTLVEIRDKEAAKFPNRKALRAGQTISWPFLSEPRAVLLAVSKKFGLELQNSELIPHDLWAAGELPKADAVTALSVVLIQFGLTFEWEDNGRAVRIVNEPESVAIQSKIRITRDAPDNVLEIAQQSFPSTEISKPSRWFLTVSGTVEAIEGIGQLAKGVKPPDATGPVRVDLQEFTFAAANARARAVLEKFRSSGIPVEWDESAMKAAGVDLDKLVDLKVENASTKETFRLLCDQLGVDFKVEKYRVRLFSK